MAVEFWVPGVPVPQGSKTGYVVGRRAVLTDSNKAVLKPWRTAVAEAAHSASLAADDVRFYGPVWVVVEFRFLRPPSVRREYPSVRPDIDKLVRAILDGITGSGLFGDDALVVSLAAVKVYAAHPGARVEVGLMPSAGVQRMKDEEED